MAELTVLRVFCDEDGRGGNPLGVFLAGDEIPPRDRQEVTADLGFSETVFVDDAESGRIAIYMPENEIDFAGHPTVGTTWLLAERGGPVDALRPPAGIVPARVEDTPQGGPSGLAFVAARPEWGPPFAIARLGSPEEVDSLDGPPQGYDVVGAWAYADEQGGVVRVRVFLPGMGIAEDEATGAFAVKLGAAIGRPIDIRQGRGSRILATPREDGTVEIGGRVVLDEVRDYSPGASGTN
jgi:predicted PhzF superfamily epimerase YddE/YHI9